MILTGANSFLINKGAILNVWFKNILCLLLYCKPHGCPYKFRVFSWMLCIVKFWKKLTKSWSLLSCKKAFVMLVRVTNSRREYVVLVSYSWKLVNFRRVSVIVAILQEFLWNHKGSVYKIVLQKERFISWASRKIMSPVKQLSSEYRIVFLFVNLKMSSPKLFTSGKNISWMISYFSSHTRCG